MFGQALLWAAGIAVVGVVLSFLAIKLRSSYSYRDSTDPATASLCAGAVAFVALLLFDWLWFFFSQPPLTSATMAGVVFVNALVALICFGVADGFARRVSAASALGVVALIVVIIAVISNTMVPMGQDNATILAHSVDIQEEEVGTYPNTSDEHIVTVGDATAKYRAQQGMQNAGGQNLNTLYELHPGVLQSINGHMWYVFEMVPSSAQNATAVHNVVPGYMLVDAEDPNAPPQAKLGEQYEIHWVLDAGFTTGMNMQRYVYEHGYNDVYLDDWTLEVDDQGKPFYTASINSAPARWEEAVPVGFLVIDPKSGDIQRLGLDQIPAWVDRVYSARMAKTMLTWWGEWGKAGYKIGPQADADRYKPDAGDPNIVYTEDGPAWQILMTSKNSDTTVNKVALFDTRSKKVRMYQAPAGLGLESSVVSAYAGNANNITNFDPTNTALHKIYGQLTWVSSMVSNTGGGATFSGVGFLKAQNPTGPDVIIGKDKGEALDKLRKQIAGGTNNAAPTENSQTHDIKGTVAAADKVVIGGQTVLIVKLTEDPGNIYRGDIKDEFDSLNSMFVKVGEPVTITYLDTGKPVRTISKITTASPATATPAK